MTSETLVLGDHLLKTGEVSAFLKHHPQVAFSSEALQKVKRNRLWLEKKILDSNQPHYGINTGFGALYDKNIQGDALSDLQENLVMSHACGMGPEVPEDIVRLMLLFKLNSLLLGYSGVRPVVLEQLLLMLNTGVYPVVYQQGSLGASGDLAPLAHLALPLLGKGYVRYRGEWLDGQMLEERFGWTPLRLQAKEGLALLNGTQFMSAYMVWSILQGEHLMDKAVHTAALALDAFDGRIEPFSERLHEVRPHAGQMHIAQKMRDLLEGSEIVSAPKKHVQDPYVFRCIPQVLGASFDALCYARNIAEIEINSATDNPIVLADEGEIISGGHFHGQPLAITMDFLSIAIAEIGSLSERRGYKLISGQRGLPPFLSPNPGLNSGFMIPQYTAASIVSQNKQLCTPASVDTIDSSNGQEDHVSMGANAATKLYAVVENTKTVVGIEWLMATQAIEFRRPMNTSPMLEKSLLAWRSLTPFLERDVFLQPYMQAARQFLFENQ
jgi:histidine ammonia-lyase